MGVLFLTERELSQLAAGGMTGDGWDNFDAGWSGHALRIETIRAPGGFWRDGGNGHRDGRAPQQSPSRAAKGSLGWMNAGMRNLFFPEILLNINIST
jgi:hypothetical protein